MAAATLFTRLEKVTKCVQTAPTRGGGVDEVVLLKDLVSGDPSPVKATGCRLGPSCVCSCPSLPPLPLSLFFVGLLKRSLLILQYKVFVCSTNANGIRSRKRAIAATLWQLFLKFIPKAKQRSTEPQAELPGLGAERRVALAAHLSPMPTVSFWNALF